METEPKTLFEKLDEVHHFINGTRGRIISACIFLEIKINNFFLFYMEGEKRFLIEEMLDDMTLSKKIRFLKLALKQEGIKTEDFFSRLDKVRVKRNTAAHQPHFNYQNEKEIVEDGNYIPIDKTDEYINNADKSELHKYEMECLAIGDKLMEFLQEIRKK